MPRRFWIVCLMLALLPLRGWAAASMTVPAALADASVQVATMDDTSAHAPASCHEAAGDAASAPAGHACNLCDLCHGATADLADATLPQLPLPAAIPRPALAHDTGRSAVGGLDRPPRIILA
jgi:hypothetical protein